MPRFNGASLLYGVVFIALLGGGAISVVKWFAGEKERQHQEAVQQQQALEERRLENRTESLEAARAAYDGPITTANYNKLDYGMTREEVVAVLGEPTLEREEGTTNWVVWRYRAGEFETSIQVSFTPSGRLLLKDGTNLK